MRETDGFTLVELMVGILCAALVSGAIITFMLMGVRTSNYGIDANADQRNAKIVITMMENLASEGSISGIEYIGTATEENGKQDWSILDNYSSPILSYSASSQALRGRNGSVLMEDVESSSVVLSEQNRVLSFSIKTGESDYKTSVFCRISAINEKSFSKEEIKSDALDELSAPSSTINVTGRSKLLDSVFEQLGSNGYILDAGHNSTGVPYSRWYCEYKENLSGNWDINTPWCAIFLSWALASVNEQTSFLEEFPIEANVDTLWSTFSEDNQMIAAGDIPLTPSSILPGDLIFFDWDHNTKSSSNTDLEHVGVVLHTDGIWVYTIEGNSSNQVAIRRYAWEDPSIYSYGRLHWDGEVLPPSD